MNVSYYHWGKELHFTSIANSVITGIGKIAFTNDGDIDFYHRNITTIKSLLINGVHGHY